MRWLDAPGHDLTVKYLTVDDGQRTSLQRHDRKDELLIVLDGTGCVEVAGEPRGGTVRIRPGTPHRVTGPLTYLEVSGYDDDTDTIRLADDYGRTAAVPPFTSHNILLPGGTQTLPGHPLVARSGMCRTPLGELEAAFGGSRDITVADLGCLEGGYAAEFARAGYNVTGIEVRPENHERAAWVADMLGLPNLRFICGDAREVLPGTRFDVVFCAGLLYHLDQPVAFLNLLGQVTRRMLILNTNFSLQDGGHPESAHHPGERCDYADSRNEGRAGHWHHEIDTPWSSFGNTSSFWLRKDDLLLSIRDAGFTSVSERNGWGDSLPQGSGGAFPDRGLFVALK